MDLGSAIIGLIVLLICISPFLIMHVNSVKGKSRMMLSLQNIAHQHHCTIGRQEFCGDFVFGMDQSSHYVFYFKQGKQESVSQFVDLSKIQSCQVVKKARTVKGERENLSIIEWIELSFLPSDKSEGETRLRVYDEKSNFQLNGELQFAEKWARQLNDRLKNKK